MSHVLLIKVNATLINPTKKTLISLANILVQNPTNIEMRYVTHDLNVKPNINIPRPINPSVTFNNNVENLMIIQRLLKTP